jgi:hypothetical protein
LPGPATDLLEAIVLWEIRSFLDVPLRLRSACELRPADDDVPGLPSRAELEQEIVGLLRQVVGLVSHPGPLEVRWGGGKKKAKSA